MGDVVIENYPIVGDLLELRASPVSVGNTSLDISVLIIARSSSSNTDSSSNSSTCDNDDVNDNNDEDDDCDSDNDDGSSYSSSSNSPSSSSSSLLQTRRVCEAFFTYVTTRGPNGEKRYVPPLEENDTEAAGEEEEAGEEDAGEGRRDKQNNIRKLLKWERTLAYFRKELIRSEQQLAKLYYNNCSLSSRGGDVGGDGDGNKYNNNNNNTNNYILEMSEVVLPSNQNHMKHLFGGVVMGWMCKR
jgi:acyl-CoA hydrolase